VQILSQLPPSAKPALVRHLIDARLILGGDPVTMTMDFLPGRSATVDGVTFASAALCLAQDQGPLGKFLAEQAGSAEEGRKLVAANALLKALGYSGDE
jgi:hypothetical protein